MATACSTRSCSSVGDADFRSGSSGRMQRRTSTCSLCTNSRSAAWTRRAPEGVQGRLDELPVEARVGVVHRGLEQCVEGLVGKDHTVLQGPAQRRPGPVHPGRSAILDIRNS